MKPTSKCVVLLVLSLSMATCVAGAEPIVGVVKVSPNGRYFVDQNNRPVFWLGTTQWELFRGYNLADARTILEKTTDKGFAFAQVMLMGVGDLSPGPPHRSLV